MSHTIISTDQAPAAIGPYSQGVKAGDLIFTAMQIALDPVTSELVGENASDQARQCLNNIKAIVEAGGGSMDHAVKLTVYLTDITQFAQVNVAYGEFFKEEPPARGVIEASNLPKGALVAIEAVAAVN